MDLLTPAREWAAVDEQSTQDMPLGSDHPHQPMPFAQQLAMLLSIVLPLAILVGAILLIWHEVPSMVGWPQIIA